MARKTIDVEWLVDRANDMLEHSTEANYIGRQGICVLLEAALHEADRYAGYSYLCSKFPTKGDDPESVALYGEGARYITQDETRRAYYLRGR